MTPEYLCFEPEGVRVRVPPAEADQRLDRFLRKLLPRARLSFLMKLVDRGHVRVEGERAAPGRRLTAGEEVWLPLAPPAFRRLAAHSLPLRPAPVTVLAEDEHFLFVAKPAGLPMYGATDSLVARVRVRLSAGGLTFRVAPAHRLDRETSGVVVFGKSPAAQRWLAAAFHDRRVEKVYLAEVEGTPPRRGVLRTALLREDRPAGPKVRPAPGGKEAVTRYRRLRTHRGRSLLELRPATGRTHQLRAQLAAAGHPIRGDRRYGGSRASSLDLRLHAWRLTVPRAEGGQVTVEAPPPPWARVS